MQRWTRHHRYFWPWQPQLASLSTTDIIDDLDLKAVSVVPSQPGSVSLVFLMAEVSVWDEKWMNKGFINSSFQEHSRQYVSLQCNVCLYFEYILLRLQTIRWRDWSLFTILTQQTIVVRTVQSVSVSVIFSRWKWVHRVKHAGAKISWHCHTT